MWQRKLAASDEEQCWEGHSGYWGSEGAGTWREAEPSVEEQREEEGEEFLQEKREHARARTHKNRLWTEIKQSTCEKQTCSTA